MFLGPNGEFFITSCAVSSRNIYAVRTITHNITNKNKRRSKNERPTQKSL